MYRVFGGCRDRRGARRAADGVAALLVSAVMVGGCSSGARQSSGSVPAPTADVVVAAVPNGTAVELAQAETLRVLPPQDAPSTGIATRYEVRPAGSNTLAATGPAGTFVAARPGTATVLVTQAPVCPSGQECAAHVVAVGSVRVTVTK